LLLWQRGVFSFSPPFFLFLFFFVLFFFPYILNPLISQRKTHARSFCAKGETAGKKISCGFYEGDDCQDPKGVLFHECSARTAESDGQDHEKAGSQPVGHLE
jgi:hypothetical protein